MKPKTEPLDQNSADFKNMVDLLAVFTEASNRLASMESVGNDSLLEILDEHRADYAAAQQTATEAEAALEQIAIAHPEWFQTRKSIKTPYGTIKSTSSTVIEVPNEEVTILLIDREGEINKEFDPKQYKREAITLNLESIEKLDDATLARLRCKRVKKENFSVTPARLDMGKALKASVMEEQKQAA